MHWGIIFMNIFRQHFKVYFVMTFLFCSVTSAIWAQAAAQPQSAAGNSGLERRRRGFYDGILLISMMKGVTMATSGSYIDHEKLYDEQLKDRIRSGAVQQQWLPGFDQVYFDAQYIPRDTSQLDMEFGITNRLGVGFTAMQFGIDVLRQETIPGISYRKEVVDPLPVQRSLFRGSLLMGLLAFHPMPERILDPYVGVRAGFLGFVGEAHAGIYADPFKQTNEVRNGIGTAAGAAIGLNIHFSSYAGLKIESAYFREFLKSDLFSQRTMNTYHVQAGFVFSYNSISDSVQQRF